MKIKRRIKLLFSCFRPRDGVVRYDDHDGIGAVKKRQRKKGKAGGMVVSGYGGKEESVVTFSSFSDDEITDKKGKNKRSFRRSLSHVLDSIFSEASLSKKSGESRKSTDNSIRSSSSKSSSSSSSKFAKFFKSMKRKASSRKSSDTEEDVTRSNSSGSSSLFSSSAIGSASFSSSSTSSLASSSRSASERGKSTLVDLKQVNNNNNNNYTKPLDQAVGGSGCYFSSNVGFCCLLIFVLVLMTWGKVFATFCTCLCLLLAPTQFKATHPRLNDVEMVDTDTEEYKKRVVMEGLLERKIFRKSFSNLR